jgi:hypothetical protein
MMPPFVDTTSTRTATPEGSPTKLSLHRCKSADSLLTDEKPPQYEPESANAKRHRSRSVDMLSSTTKKERTQSFDNWVGSFFYEESNPPDLQQDQQYPTTDDDCSDEESSVGYFERSNFLQADWSNTVEHIPPVGFEVLAGGILCFHPLLFVTGALTACGTLGTVHAVAATYDFC